MKRSRYIPSYVKDVAWTFSEGHCWYCGDALSPFGPDLQWDHIVPHSQGGGNDVDNIVPACFICNQVKSDSGLEAWRKSIRPDHAFWFEYALNGRGVPYSTLRQMCIDEIEDARDQARNTHGFRVCSMCGCTDWLIRVCDDCAAEAWQNSDMYEWKYHLSALPISNLRRKG